MQTRSELAGRTMGEPVVYRLFTRGFFFFMKNHLRAYYFRFGRSGWIGIIWLVSSEKLKAPLDLPQVNSDSVGFEKCKVGIL